MAPPILIGRSQATRQIEEDIECAARSDAKVLISGESGVGKEVVARLIHDRSSRSRQPLVAINCAGIPDSLLASELFGHMRGSFTDAHRDRVGLFEQGHRGTVLLDEVGEMSSSLQALVLRFLESGEIQPVGSHQRITKVDVRIIAATNRALLERVSQNQFREDLYYRLNVIHIEIPPLRSRLDDVPLLFDHFLRHYAKRHQIALPCLAEESRNRLMAYHWPGNVRELKNLAERLVVRSRGGEITPAELPGELSGSTRACDQCAGAASSPTRSETMFDSMSLRHESFWSVVHEPFMARDITREDLRSLVRHGLTATRGSYKALLRMFNMPPEDYKRFLNFLRKHHSHLSIHEFRGIAPPTTTRRRRSEERDSSSVTMA